MRAGAPRRLPGPAGRPAAPAHARAARPDPRHLIPGHPVPGHSGPPPPAPSRPLRRAAARAAVLGGLLGLAAAALPAAAQEQCRLALQLALDVSASVDAAEYRLQVDGLASALIDPAVTAAFLDGPGPVALSIFEWSGRFQQDVLVDWVLVTSEADLLAAAETVARTSRRNQDFPTALGYALGFAATRFEAAPPCLFRTLDVSGDGQNNDGFPPAAAYDHFAFGDITVNGLAIGGASQQIEEYYLSEVIRGPGAFVEFAASHADFAEAMRRKLEREVRAMILGEGLPEAAPPPALQSALDIPGEGRATAGRF